MYWVSRLPYQTSLVSSILVCDLCSMLTSAILYGGVDVDLDFVSYERDDAFGSLYYTIS